jgi:hypothetical protein
MSVQDLQQSVEHLSKEELETFSKWFEEYLSDQWDEQIERDVKAGKFDSMLKRVHEDFEAGRCTPL